MSDETGEIMRTVIVKKGETLSQIAEREMGNWREWLAIYFANMPLIRDDIRGRVCIRKFGGTPPDWIFPEMVLTIPDRGVR